MSSKNPGKGKQTGGKRRKTQDTASPSASGEKPWPGGESEGHRTVGGNAKWEEWAKAKTAKEWVDESEWLSEELGRAKDALGYWAADEGRLKEPLDEETHTTWFQVVEGMGQAQEFLREYSRRYLEALRRFNSEKEAKREVPVRGLVAGAKPEEGMRLAEGRTREAERERDRLRLELSQMEAQRGRMEEEKKEMEREREQLRSQLSQMEEERRRERAIPPNSEPMEVVVEEGEAASPLATRETIVPAILDALERWFEEKWERMASQGAPPSQGREKETQATPDRSGSWAGVVARGVGGGRTSPTGMRGPPTGGKKNGGGDQQKGAGSQSSQPSHGEREEKGAKVAQGPHNSSGGSQPTTRRDEIRGGWADGGSAAGALPGGAGCPPIRDQTVEDGGIPTGSQGPRRRGEGGQAGEGPPRAAWGSGGGGLEASQEAGHQAHWPRDGSYTRRGGESGGSGGRLLHRRNQDGRNRELPYGDGLPMDAVPGIGGD